MEYILITFIFLILALFIVMKVVNKNKLKIEKNEIINILNKYGKYYKENSLYEYKNTIYKVAFITIKQEEELILNNLYVFETFKKGKSKLIDTKFLDDSIFETLAIIYPSNAPIKRYVNENELVFIEDYFKSEKYLLTQKYYLEQLLKAGFTI